MRGGNNLTLEEFIMETIISALIGALSAIIVSIISYVGLVKRDYKDLDKKISVDNLNLSNGHKTLSKEHQGLEKQLSEKHQSITKQQEKIENTVVWLKENVIEERGKKEKLSQQTLDIDKSLNHINALFVSLQNTQLENQQLKREIQELRAENERLKNQLKQYKQKEYEEEMGL